MLIALATVSICPGATPSVKAQALATLRSEPVNQAFCWMLSAEIGEVNTLLCAFRCPSAEDTLAGIDRWIDALRASPAGAQLRHTEVSLWRTEAGATAWERFPQDAAAVLLQEFQGMPASMPARQDLCLRSLTGMQGRLWVLTPVAHPDDAIALSIDTLAAQGVDLRDSIMWLPAA
jgi:hypothetical protein